LFHKIDPKEIPDIIRSQNAIALNDFDQYLKELTARRLVWRSKMSHGKRGGKQIRKIFLSYAHADLAYAQQLSSLISSASGRSGIHYRAVEARRCLVVHATQGD